MKKISPVLREASSNSDKLADRVVRRNPKVCDGEHNLVDLEEWIRGMRKILAVMEVPYEKKLNIGIIYLAREADI